MTKQLAKVLFILFLKVNTVGCRKIMEFANQSLPAEEQPFHYRILYLCNDLHRSRYFAKELLKLKCL